MQGAGRGDRGGGREGRGLTENGYEAKISKYIIAVRARPSNVPTYREVGNGFYVGGRTLILLPVRPGPAWVLLGYVLQTFFTPLYGITGYILHGSKRILCMSVRVYHAVRRQPFS